MEPLRRHTLVSEGNCMNIKVAKSSLTEEEIVENVMAVVAALGDFVPRKFKNVQVPPAPLPSCISMYHARGRIGPAR